jgi:molybdopterin synthase catalytic subunit
MADLVEDPIALEPLVAAVSRPECGAIAVFVGTTRDHRGGRRVEHLYYEAYRPMALEALRRIEEESARRVAEWAAQHPGGWRSSGHSIWATCSAPSPRSAGCDAPGRVPS